MVQNGKNFNNFVRAAGPNPDFPQAAIVLDKATGSRLLLFVLSSVETDMPLSAAAGRIPRTSLSEGEGFR